MYSPASAARQGTLPLSTSERRLRASRRRIQPTGLRTSLGGNASKFAPPPVPETAVSRPRLLHLLDAAVRRRVTLVVAPTGYGKTTMLAQWIAASRGRRIAWFTVDPADDDPLRFEQGVRTALEPWLQSGNRELEALTRRAEPASVLVLDDVHTISNAKLFNRLASDLDALPSLRLILISRSDPVFPAYRFRLRDQVVELRQRDLAFDRHEARELLKASGRPLSDAQVTALLDRSEGCVTGLQLASMSVRSVDDVDSFVRTFCGDDRHVADYLTEHILNVQPEDMQRFLLQTSVLHELCASLCDFILGVKDSRAMLARLERASAMTSPVDHSHEWFRYHNLFRVFLRQHLRTRMPDAERRLLERAADWHFAHDRAADAIDYLAEAGAWQRALDATLKNAPQLVARGRADEVARWVAMLPTEMRRERPALQLLEAAGHMSGPDTDTSRRILDALASQDGLSAPNRAVARTLEAVWQLERGSPDVAIEHADRALRDVSSITEFSSDDLMALPGTRSLLMATAQYVRATAMMELGDFTEARAALAVVAQANVPLLDVQAFGLEGLIDVMSGRLRAGTRSATRSLDLAKAFGLADHVATVPALLALAMAARERDDLDEASVLLEGARRHAEPSTFIAGLMVTEQARLALAMGRRDEAYAVIALHRG